jgi:hypothetical protein
MKTSTVILLVGGTAVAAYLLIGRNGIVAPARQQTQSKPAGGSSNVVSIASSLLAIGASVIPAIFDKNKVSGGNAQSAYPESAFSDVSGSGDVLFQDN